MSVLSARKCHLSPSLPLSKLLMMILIVIRTLFPMLPKSFDNDAGDDASDYVERKQMSPCALPAVVEAAAHGAYC